MSGVVLSSLCAQRAYQLQFHAFKVWENPTHSLCYYLFSQGVVFQTSEITLTTDMLLAWRKKNFPEACVVAPGQNGGEPYFEEMYIPGFVSGTLKNMIFQAQRGYLRPAQHYALLTGVQVSFPAKNKQRLYIHAQKLEMVGNQAIFQSALISTCSFAKPHYKIKVHQIGVNLKGHQGGKYQVQEVNLYGAQMNLAQTALMPERDVALVRDGQMRKPFLRRFDYSHNKIFGYRVQMTTGWELTKNVPAPQGKTKQKKWGDFQVTLDEMQKRGLGTITQTLFKGHQYQGYVKTFFIHDQGPDPSIKFERQFLPQEVKNRFEVHTYLRATPLDHWTFESEIHKVSDRFFRFEFLEREFKEEKAPESFVSLRYVKNDWSVYGLARLRLNSYQTQTEYLPSVYTDLLGHPLGPSGVYLTSKNQAAFLRQRFDRQEENSPVESFRFDTSNEFSYPVKTHFMIATPFVEIRPSYYSSSPHEHDRLFFSEGLKLYSEFYKNYPHFFLSPHTLVRHTIGLDTRLSHNTLSGFHPTGDRVFDPTDSLDSFTEIYVGIYNFFDKKGQGGREGVPLLGDYHRYLDFNLALEYYPFSGDTRKFNEQNFLPPQSFLLTPLTQLNRRFSNVYTWGDFYPNKRVTFSLDSEYNIQRARLEVLESQLQYRWTNRLNVGISASEIEGLTNAWSALLYYKMSPTWQMRLQEQFDFYSGHVVGNILTLRRDLHDAYLDFVVSHNTGKGVTTIFMTLSPKFLEASSNRSFQYE